MCGALKRRAHDEAGAARRLARERGVIKRTVRTLDDLRAVVRRVQDPHREAVGVGYERVPDPERHDLTVGADAYVARPDLARGVPRATRAVVAGREVGGPVDRVVVVVEEVPSRDVVRVAVAVVVELPAGGAGAGLGVRGLAVAQPPG